MFYQYEIKELNGEEVLFLYSSFKYEFADEFYSSQDKQILSYTSNYIKANHIPFKGNMIYYVVDGVIVKKMRLNRSKKVPDSLYSPDYYYVKLKLDSGSFMEVSLKEYLLSALFSLYSDEYHEEVLKCICILINTYVFYVMRKKHYLLVNSPFFQYQDSSSYQKCYDNYQSLYSSFLMTILDCQGMFLSYQGKYILPFFHYSNNGVTVVNSKYPYLSSVKSYWDITSSKYLHHYHFSYSELSTILDLKKKLQPYHSIFIQNKHLYINDQVFTIKEIKSKLHLASDDFIVIMNHNTVDFITRGNGSALGLSLFGASYIEKNGGKFHHILSYYYPKCQLLQHIKELS